MPKWVLPLLVLLGLYLLSVGPLVTYTSRENGRGTMVPAWVRSYGSPYLWLYEQSPKELRNISDGYFRWCAGMLTKAEKEAELMKDGVTPRPPPLFGL